MSSIRLADVPRTLRVRGYFAYSIDQFGGRTLAAWDPAKPVAAIHFDKTPALSLPYAIRPKSISPRFEMAKVRILTYPSAATITTCAVSYTLGTDSQLYEQQFGCRFTFGRDT